MEYSKKTLVAEGKTKRLWQTEEEKYLIAEFKDDAENYHGKKHVFFEGKGKLANKINAILMNILEESGIQTHFVKQLSETESLIKHAEMIPVEVVVRNYAAGSICSRLNFEGGKKLKAPVLEFCYKNEELGDPVINEYHAYAMGLCTQDEMEAMCYTVARINKVLTDVMNKIGIILADFKVEFGKVNGRLLVADEISPTTSRMWEKTTKKKFNCEGSTPAYEYEVILSRLQDLTKEK